MAAAPGSYQGQEYEHDPRWSRVDRYAIEHLDQHNPHQSALLYAKELAETEGLPNIEVSALQGNFLAVQCQLIQAKQVLELGTLGGYSAICMAGTSPDVKVVSVESDPHHKAVAEQAIRHAGLDKQVEVLQGAGVDVLPQVRADVEQGRREKFDLVFIDADKPNNLNYFKEAIQMSRSRACIIVDNVVRKGGLADAEASRTDARIRGSREAVEGIGKDPRVLRSTLVQTVGEKNYDGFLICVVR